MLSANFSASLFCFDELTRPKEKKTDVNEGLKICTQRLLPTKQFFTHLPSLLWPM